jgi:ribokinase
MSKVVVAGSINMDIVLQVGRLPVLGETIHGKGIEYYPGGKGLNQAVAAAGAGVETMLIGKTGNDTFADDLKGFLGANHVDTSMVTKCEKASGTALINVTDAGDNTIVVIGGSNMELSPKDINSSIIKAGDILVSQFEIPLETIEEFFRKGRDKGATTILNPSPIKDCSKELLLLTDVLIVNEVELGVLAGESVNEASSNQDIENIAAKIKKFEKQIVIVTLGSRGALIVAEKTHVVNGRKVVAIDTVGAGDCFAGFFASCLAKKYSIEKSAEMANIAASICVTRKGAAPSMPKESEVLLVYKEKK